MLPHQDYNNRTSEELSLQELINNIYQHQSEDKGYRRQNDELKVAVKQHCLRISQLQLQNKQIKKRNAQLKEINENLTHIYQECLTTLDSQISGNTAKQSFLEKSLLKMDLQAMKMNAMEKQKQLLNTIAKLEKTLNDKEVERQLLVQNMSAKQQALKIQVISYNNLIEEKTESIDKFTSQFKCLQNILEIQSKQVDFDLVRVKLEGRVLEGRRMAERLEQKQIHIETLKHTIRILSQQ